MAPTPRPNLPALKTPIAIRKDHIATSPTTLRIKQKCMRASLGDFEVTSSSTTASEPISSDPKDHPLFTVAGKTLSLSQRRSVLDASGLPVFDVHRETLGETWFVKLPGAQKRGGEWMARLEPQRVTEWSQWRESWKERIDVYVRNCCAGGEDVFGGGGGGGSGREVELRVRGQDIWKKRTSVFLGDGETDIEQHNNKVLDIRLVNLASTYMPFVKDNEWEVQVAEGFDVSLVSSSPVQFVCRLVFHFISFSFCLFLIRHSVPESTE